MEATESTPISGDVGPPDAAWWGRRAWALLVGVRARAPLVQCITNFVSMDISANALLAAGASPAMVHGLREVADFTPHCDAVYVNVGTLSEDWVPAMRAAAAAAAAAGRPWVLDPVAAAASGFRMDACLGLVGLRPAVVRGNASEILALNSASASRSGGSKFQSQPAQLQQQLGVQQQPSMQQRLQASAGMLQQQNNIDQQKQFIQAQRGLQQVSSSSHAGAGDWQEEIYQKGVDSLHDSQDAVEAAKELARSSGAVVAVSGAVDFITDGHQVVGASNGVAMMQKITATGCAVTALITAFVAVDPSDVLVATACALAIFGLAGELGMDSAKGPASLRMHLIDSLYCLDEQTVTSCIKISRRS